MSNPGSRNGNLPAGVFEPIVLIPIFLLPIPIDMLKGNFPVLCRRSQARFAGRGAIRTVSAERYTDLLPAARDKNSRAARRWIVRLD